MDMNNGVNSKGLWLMTGPVRTSTPARAGVLLDWYEYETGEHGWVLSGGTNRHRFALGWHPCVNGQCPLRGMPKALHTAVVIIDNLVASMQAVADAIAALGNRVRNVARI